jgi:hypothetical protein
MEGWNTHGGCSGLVTGYMNLLQFYIGIFLTCVVLTGPPLLISWAIFLVVPEKIGFPILIFVAFLWIPYAALRILPPVLSAFGVGI